MATLSENHANRVYDILVEYAGALPDQRIDFIWYMTVDDTDYHQFRFDGSLEPSSALCFQPRTFGANLWVSCYDDDMTDTCRGIIKETNRHLGGIEYLIRVAEERDVTEEDEETAAYIMNARYESDDD